MIAVTAVASLVMLIVSFLNPEQFSPASVNVWFSIFFFSIGALVPNPKIKQKEEENVPTPGAPPGAAPLVPPVAQ